MSAGGGGDGSGGMGGGMGSGDRAPVVSATVRFLTASDAASFLSMCADIGGLCLRGRRISSALLSPGEEAEYWAAACASRAPGAPSSGQPRI